MKHKIIVLGAKGMLGTELLSVLQQNKDHTVTGLGSQDIDICKLAELEAMFRKYSPTIVINCAAFTHVDACEDQKDLAMQINGYAPGVLAKISKTHKTRLIHISTDYVFDGSSTTPISEDTPTQPINAYGETKQFGETQIQKHMDDYLIIRTAWLYGQHGKNFVKTMLNLSSDPNREIKVVNDQIGSPTNAADLSLAIANLLEHKENKILHFSNSGYCSWYAFAKKIFELKNIKNKLTPITSDKFPTKANRPKYSVMSLGNTEKALGYKITPWEETLKDFLNKSDKNNQIH